MRLATPRGFRDVLPAEAAEREAVLGSVARALAAWGYLPVETPVAEVLEVLEAGAGPLGDTAFRLVDVDGQLLALRPEFTVPIARLVASRFGGRSGPFRLRYGSEVFREHESLRGQPRQFTQAGIELVGLAGAQADAEVIAACVDAVRVAGLTEFTVSVGSVAVLRAVIDAAGMDDAWGIAVMTAAHERNLVELGLLAARPGVAAHVSDALGSLARIRGGREAIAQCRQATVGCGTAALLDEMDEAWLLLEAAGVADRVAVDFSVMRSFDYYTGMVLEVYAQGLGVPLGGGGRYDGVFARFGLQSPAAGFALGIERLLIARLEQGCSASARALDVVVGGSTAPAMATSAALRARGLRVMCVSGGSEDVVRALGETGAAAGLLSSEEGISLVATGGEGARAATLDEVLDIARSVR